MTMTAIVAIGFPLCMVGLVLLVTWIMGDTGSHRTVVDQHESSEQRHQVIERKAA